MPWQAGHGGLKIQRGKRDAFADCRPRSGLVEWRTGHAELVAARDHFAQPISVLLADSDAVHGVEQLSRRQVRLRAEEVGVCARRIRLPAQTDDRGCRREARRDRVSVSQADCAAGNTETERGQGTSPSRASQTAELVRVVGEGFPPVDEHLVALVLIEAGDAADELSEVPGVSPVLGAVLSPEVQNFVEGDWAEVQSDLLEIERNDVPRGWHRCQVEDVEKRPCRTWVGGRRLEGISSGLRRRAEQLGQHHQDECPHSRMKRDRDTVLGAARETSFPKLLKNDFRETSVRCPAEP